MIDFIDRQEMLAYIAGFLDGEGYFGVTKGDKITIRCSNTNRHIIRWMCDHLGGSFTISRRKRKHNHRIIYTWGIVSKQAASFCKEIVPYLKEKSEQALILIAFDQTMGLKRKYPQEIEETRTFFKNRLKELKRVES